MSIIGASSSSCSTQQGSTEMANRQAGDQAGMAKQSKLNSKKSKTQSISMKRYTDPPRNHILIYLNEF